MKCKACGTIIPVGAPFCPECGKATLDSISGQNTPKQEKQQIKSKQSSAPLAMKRDVAREVSLVVAFEGLIASIVGIFLPFFEVRVLGTSASVSLWSGRFRTEAILLMVILVVGWVCVCIFENGKGFSQVALGTIILAISLFDMFYNMERLKEENLDSLIVKGEGFYLLVLGGILLINSGMILNVLKTRRTRQ